MNKFMVTKIYEVRGKKVMLDRDLSILYEVETKYLNQAVKRNRFRFPEDFMFQLIRQEYDDLRSHFVTANISTKSRTYPYAFTEHGILMLSSVLNSKKAAEVNIEIMRTFVQMRRIIFEYKELNERMDVIESKYDQNFHEVFEFMKFMIDDDNTKLIR